VLVPALLVLVLLLSCCLLEACGGSALSFIILSTDRPTHATLPPICSGPVPTGTVTRRLSPGECNAATVGLSGCCDPPNKLRAVTSKHRIITITESTRIGISIAESRQHSRKAQTERVELDLRIRRGSREEMPQGPGPPQGLERVGILTHVRKRLTRYHACDVTCCISIPAWGSVGRMEVHV